jgi:hypothetical protein
MCFFTASNEASKVHMLTRLGRDARSAAHEGGMGKAARGESFSHDARDVGVDGVDADVEFTSDFFVAFPLVG